MEWYTSTKGKNRYHSTQPALASGSSEPHRYVAEGGIALGFGHGTRLNRGLQSRLALACQAQ